KPPMTVDEERQQIDAMIAKLVQIDLDLLTAQAELRARREVQEHERGAVVQPIPDQVTEDRVKQAFYNDPEVIALAEEIKKVEDDLDRQKRIIPLGARTGVGNEGIRTARQSLAKLNQEWKGLWTLKSDEFRKRAQGEASRNPQLHTIDSLEKKISILKEKRAALKALYEKQREARGTTDDDSFKFAYAQQQLTSLLSRDEQIKRNLAQV